MLMAEDSSNWSTDADFFGFDAENFGGEDMSIDLDEFNRLLEEEPPASCPEDSSLGNKVPAEAVSGAGYQVDKQFQSGSQVLKEEPSIVDDVGGPGNWQPLYSNEASDSGPGGSFESAGDPAMFIDYQGSEAPAHTGSSGPWHSLYVSEASDTVAGGLGGSFDSGWNPGMIYDYQDKKPQSQNSSLGHVYSTSLKDWTSLVPCKETSITDRVGVSQPTSSTSSSFSEGNTSHGLDIGNLDVPQGNADVTGKVDSDSSQCLNIVNMDKSSRMYGAFGENTIETLWPSENNSCTSIEMPLQEVDVGSPNVTSTESTLCQSSDIFDNHYTAMDDMSFDDTHNYMYYLFPSNEDRITNVKDESVEFQTDSSCSSSKMNVYCQEGITGKYGFESPMIYASDTKEWNFNLDHGYRLSPLSGNSSLDADYCPVDDKASVKPFTSTETYMSIKREDTGVKNENIDEFAAPSSMGHPFPFMDETVTKPSYSADLNGLDYQLPAAQPISLIMDRLEAKHTLPKSFPPSKVGPESIQSNFSEKSPADDDDISIIEDISDPAPTPHFPVVTNNCYPTLTHSPALGNKIRNSQHCGDHDTRVGGIRFKTREQLILRQASQERSQPKSEAIPPDGVLAVPLLRHQRIALSWMSQKETSLRCSGGILADDQGLGKTISTIALILKERPPATGATQDKKKCKLEALDLDKDDDILSGKQDLDAHLNSSNETSEKRMKLVIQTKGRLACGTLVVCPTSVLRQWADELHNKVTEKGRLSVLIYHGGNRTKDPCELAKYDVVLTTYSIVSMEVPKQPLADGEDDSPSMGLSSSKKRKYPSKSSKGKKGLESAALESAARPLAKVGWFRVVLDEAQSIKNHRTQVARACWGLRAKRRWCLSGTPIQNAIDDLYSYFRFLRFDPLDAYKSFCANIKYPISKNPTKGYRKLQTILETIMLRRTKGTLLDGEPIINLPPKSIELKRVEFSAEERDFYSRLECDSRAQFEEYAAAGTVKQNYVNILLMLLRLRQACDHPLLVRRYESQSLWKATVEKAKKLPHDKKVSLLNCLEASLAICGICNLVLCNCVSDVICTHSGCDFHEDYAPAVDAPEDAVVSECGHVFCSQCICDSLTGDDNQCPNTNCKVRLTESSVFSKATLKSSLSDQPDSEGMDSEVFDAVESFYEDHSFNSSKIKAAIEVLCSMCKPKILTTENSDDKNASSSMVSDIDGVESLEVGSDSKNLVVDGSSNKSDKVVREKAIVFSQWTRMLDLLESSLKTSGLEYRRLDGTMSVAARDKAIKDFNTLPKVSVIIMSLKAASLGLNMVAACHVLLLDLWWNPTTEDQAIDRAHRIGQTRPVTVLRLTVKDTVEDRILALQKKKREMVASAFGEDENGGHQTRLTEEDLGYLFRE